MPINRKVQKFYWYLPVPEKAALNVEGTIDSLWISGFYCLKFYTNWREESFFTVCVDVNKLLFSCSEIFFSPCRARRFCLPKQLSPPYKYFPQTCAGHSRISALPWSLIQSTANPLYSILHNSYFSRGKLLLRKSPSFLSKKLSGNPSE